MSTKIHKTAEYCKVEAPNYNTW